MHVIILEEGHKLSVEQHRHINPIMKEVVKEILKWLDARIIYPTSDSSCISPIQCVPKEGRLTIVRNQKNYEISTKIVIR